MYDTLRLRSTSGVDEYGLEHLACALTSVNHNQSNGVNTINGKLHNLFVSANHSRTYVTGSAATFVHGSNVNPLPFCEVGTFLDAITDALSINFWEADVCRVDVAATIEVNAPVQAYLLQMGEMPGLARTLFKNTLYYGTNKNALSYAIYDKGRESGLTTSSNLLRPEMRIRGTKKVRSIGIATGYDLSLTETHKTLCTMWKDKLNTIKKLPAPAIDAQEIQLPKEAVEAFIAANADSYLQFIEAARAQGGLAQPHHLRRAKAKLYEAAEKYAAGKFNLIDEVADKWNSIAA